MGRITMFVAANLLAATASAVPWSYDKRASSNDTILDFEDLTPSPEINWIQCFERFVCTNLEVPLDYEDPEAGTTNIAFIKLAASDNSTQDILYNPGGPGAGGVDAFLQGFADDILKAFNGDYNIVTFDPRGVANSGPTPLTCFSTPEEAEAWEPTPDSAPLAEHYFASRAYGEWCTKANADTNARYAGTAAIVQDMMHFTELQAVQNGQEAGEATVWYYGVSYGTVVGQTLAAMYPDRVERMILDGNVHGGEHYTGLVPSDINDTDRSLEFFFDYCFEAGPELCAFAGNSSSAAEIDVRFRTLLHNLEYSPIVLADENIAPAPAIVTRDAFISWAFGQLYGPMSGFPSIANIASDLEQGIPDSFLEASGIEGSTSASASAHGEATGEEITLITCVDAATRYSLSTLEAFEELTDLLERKSYFHGKATARSNILMCNGIEIMPPTSQLFPGFSEVIKTAVPILFVGTTGDPITPLSSAFKMSEYFQGSAVLTQNSPGHGYMGVESSCTNSLVQAYLEDLTLPEEGTICETDVKPFVNEPSAKKAKRSGLY